MLRGLRTVVFDVDELDLARLWYMAVTGVTPYFDEDYYVGFDVDGFELGLRPKDGAHGPGVGGDTAYWAVDDLDAVHNELIAAGATEREAIAEVGDGIEVSSVVDPFGNVLGLIYNPHFSPRLVYADADDVADDAIVKSATVPLAPDDAWKLWATSEGLGAWWTKANRVDLRPGGSYELYFLEDNTPGERGADWCRVLSFLPGRMLSFTWNAPPQLDKTRPLHTWVVLTFEAEGEGTKVTLNHLGWPKSEMAVDETQWPATYAYFDDAWGRVMKLFEENAA
jgi:uncharacterized protein YndB with AHSA1/START domain/predicted enzyme related to lactoylglutathione lyase